MAILCREDVHVNGFGFLLMFILPGAYVDVPTEEIRALTPFRQLKVTTSFSFCVSLFDLNRLLTFTLV